MNRFFNVLLAALAGLLSLASVAQTAQPAAASSPAKPKNYVLVSAVGDQFTYVRQKQQVGSNIIDNFDRKVFKVPN
ncbi:MAG TPA: hypothetical protein VFV17_00095, partial [Usitatibacteraceae bacterium]|nr:hypothetical protein [Usitatibacteraceae bacterium]